VTKSGTNAWHGGAWEFNRDDRLQATNFFATTKPALKQNQFGVALGGPLVQNRLFLFSYFEGFKNTQGVTDTVTRQRLAQAYIESRLIRINNERAAAKRKRGGEVGPEGSITKLMSAEFNQRLQNLALDLEGIEGVAWEGEQAERGQRGRPTWLADGNDRGTMARGFLRAQANTIEGGTSDIMRNILGERVLGLPKDPDVSRDVAWKDVLRSG